MLPAVTGTYVPSGNTTGTGPWTLSSTDSTYSELDLVFSSGIDFGNLTSLSVDYNAIKGGIGGGGPRIYLLLDTDHNGTYDGKYIQIQFGPAGSFVDPALGPGNTGNLLALLDNGRYDLSGLGLSAYTDRAAALAAASGFSVLEADLVLDSFGGADKTFLINGITAAGTVAAVPEPANWAMMIAGFGLAGAAMRRRKIAPSISFA